MVNHDKTEECYKNENYTYPKPIEQKGYEMWLQKVTNPNTGTFYKISDLPIEWRKNKEDKPYPLKHANQIIRIKTAIHAPKYRLDRSARDNLENSHIK
jgi:hypothetical protein